jgi:hypothetical protein
MDEKAGFEGPRGQGGKGEKTFKTRGVKGKDKG